MAVDISSNISFESFDRRIPAGETGTYSVQVDVGDLDTTTPDQDVQIKAFLYVAGEEDQSIVSSSSTTVVENESTVVSLSHRFQRNESLGNTIQSTTTTIQSGAVGTYPRVDSPVWIRATLDYGINGTTNEEIDTLGSNLSSDDTIPKVTSPDERRIGGDVVTPDAPGSDSPLTEAFDGQVTFAIRDIDWEDDSRFFLDVNPELELENFPNPTVAIDGSGRFAKHEIIGGATVRQKIGEDPLNISINGVCNEEQANVIDALRNAKNGRIFSTRLPGSTDASGSSRSGGSLLVQFGSTSTEPITDGGAANFETGELLYTFTINAIEVIQ